MDKLADVLTKWQNDLQFREAWRKNPEQALIDAHIDLSEEDVKKVQPMLKKLYDELDSKINK